MGGGRGGGRDGGGWEEEEKDEEEGEEDLRMILRASQGEHLGIPVNHIWRSILPHLTAIDESACALAPPPLPAPPPRAPPPLPAPPPRALVAKKSAATAKAWSCQLLRACWKEALRPWWWCRRASRSSNDACGTAAASVGLFLGNVGLILRDVRFFPW